jgi:uncharacterized membrane protein YvbJ
VRSCTLVAYIRCRRSSSTTRLVTLGRKEKNQGNVRNLTEHFVLFFFLKKNNNNKNFQKRSLYTSRRQASSLVLGSSRESV